MLLLTCISHTLLLCQTQQRALEVFLVVDNSGSMRQYDPSLSMPGALATFADRMPLNSRLGVLIFDKDVKVILELTGTASRQFQSDVGGTLRRIDYSGSRSDLAGGVERAIYELRQHGRPDARRAIVFVTDGVLNVGSKAASARKTRWLREDLAMEAKRLGISIFAVTVSQAADYQLVLSLARTTGGEYYRALTPALMPVALAQVNDQLTKVVANAESWTPTPVNPRGPVQTSSLRRQFMLASLTAIALVFLALGVAFARRWSQRTKRPSPEIVAIAGEGAHPVPSLSALREQGTEVSRELANTTDLLTQTNSRVNQFQTAVERYALSNYQALQEAEEQCVTIARECILLLDHLDIMIQRAEHKGEPVNSLRAARSRLCTLLERAQIEEIPVNAGEVFDSAVQVATSAVGSSSPEGVVVEVSRKGYAMKVRGRSDVILRAAEVTVSARQAEVQPGSGGPA
ncbi:MAG: nucleotide exchange factor GrpE [Candidatus Sulfotelmatobacter sp.]